MKTAKAVATSLHITVLSIIVLALPVTLHCQILTLYNQPSGASPSGFNGYDSQAGLFTAYDSFVLQSSAQIMGVSWDGFFGFGGPDMGYLTGFNISFYADSAGQPGTLLSSATIVGTANETLSAQTFEPTYEYSAALPTAFSAMAGNQYWISVVASLNPSSPEWSWLVGTGGDGIGYDSGLGSEGSDLTFALYGVPVPEPLNLPLISLGCLMLVCRRQR